MKRNAKKSKQTNKKKTENYAKILLIIGQNKLDVLFKLQKFWLHFPFVLRYLSAFLICLSQETALDVHKIIYSTNLLIYIFFFLLSLSVQSAVFERSLRFQKKVKQKGKKTCDKKLICIVLVDEPRRECAYFVSRPK